MIKWVIKASGERVEYNRNKIINSLIRAGADRSEALEIVSKVERKARDGITTKEILKLAIRELDSRPGVAMRYNLKNAIMSLGPSGFPFERFFAEVLKAYGYETALDKILPGKNINHEVDIVATDSKGKKYMVECKYHNEAGIYTDVKAALYTYARYLDLKKFFDFPWLASNTKFSSDAINYAKGVSMNITCWNYPENDGLSLRHLIEEKGVYPITILSSARGFVKDRLAETGIITTNGLLNLSIEELSFRTKLPEKLIRKLHSEAGCLKHNENDQ